MQHHNNEIILIAIQRVLPLKNVRKAMQIYEAEGAEVQVCSAVAQAFSPARRTFSPSPRGRGLKVPGTVENVCSTGRSEQSKTPVLLAGGAVVPHREYPRG